MSSKNNNQINKKLNLNYLKKKKKLLMKKVSYKIGLNRKKNQD